MPNEIKPVIVADDGINRSIKPVIVADDGINKVKKKGVSQSTQDGGAISSEASKTENQKRSDSLSSARRWANVTEPKTTSSKYKTDDYIDILENKPLKKKKVVSVQPDKYVPEVKVEELDVPTYKEAETMMEEDFGRKEFDAYQNINKIDKNIAFKTEDEAVEELRKKFKGSGFIFETTGVGNKIKISTSTNGGLTTINSKEFDLIPSTLYGQAQTGMPVAQTEDLNRISNDKYNEIVDFMSKSILKKTDKDFLKKEVKDYGQLVNLMADNPYKYGEEFLNQYDTDRWFDNQYKDLVIESKSLKRDEDQLLAQYDELIKNPTSPEQEAQIKNKINSLDERKNILKSKYDDLGRLNDKLKVSSAVYYKNKEKQGNTLGLISKSFIKGAFNMEKALAGVAADVMPYVLPEGSLMPYVQREKLKASGMSETEIKDYASKQLRKEIVPQIEKGLTDLVSFGTTDEYLQSKDRGDLEKVASFLSESIGTALSAGGNPTLQKVAFFTQSYNAIEDEMSSSQFDGLNQFEKKLISVPYAMTIGALENIGFKFTTGATKSPLFNKLVNNIVFRTFSNLPKDASATLMQNELKRNTAAMLANAGLRIVGGALVEGAVEGTQQLDEIAIKNISNAITDKDYFQDVPDITTAKGINQAIGAAATDAYYGALGGLIMSAGSESISAIRDGYSNRKSDDDFAIFSNSLKDNNLRSSIESDIKSKIVSGDITKEEAKAQIESMNKSYSILQSIPDNLSLRDQRDSFNLILEKQKIQKETEGKDPALVAAQTNRINEINNELKTISENAVQKQTTGEVPVQPEATVGREMEEGKPQAEPQGVTEEGKVAAEEEVTKRISELEALIASDNASMEKEGQGNLIPEARQSILNELQTLKAETKPIEETIVVEPITKQEQKQNLVTQENVEELRAQQTIPVAQKIFTAAKLAMKALPGVKVYVHNTTAEFDKGIGQKSAEGTKGAYVDGEVHINLENGADVVTMLHESLHHGLVVKGVQSGAMLDLAKGLKSVVSDKGLRQRLDDFVSGYDASEQSEEYVAELGAIMAEAQQELSTTKFQQFKNLINKIAQKLGLPVVFTASANAKNAVDFMNSLTKSIRTGQELKPTEPYSVGEAVSVKPNAPMKIKYQRKAEYNVDFVTKIPTKSLEDVVNKYDGRVFMIQSDATGVGYDSNGDPIYGGIGYIAIKENVDGKIGFASVDMNTAKTTISKMINRYGPNEKIAVLVMVQNPSSTVGNYYGGKYFGRALIELQKQSKTNYKAIANSFVDFIESKQSVIDALNKNKTKQKLIELINNPGKFDEVGFAEEFVKDTTFDVRREILKTLLPEKADIITNKSTPYIKQSLKDLGFNRMAFLNEYGDNTLFTEDMYASDEGGLLAAGFEMTLPTTEDIDQFTSGIENRGIKHHLFNGKLPYTDESFLLDGLYPVNENFSEFAKSQMVFNEENLNKDQLKKIVQEKFSTDKSYDDKYTRVNSKNFVKIQDRTYTHLTSPNKIKFKAELQETNPEYFKEQLTNVSTDIARGMGFTAEKGAKQEALVEKAKTKGFSKIKFQKAAPNGKPSNLNDKQWEQVRTPEFKKWFGDWENDPKNASKIVDDNGEPLVVYHGTRKSFDEFSYDVKPANFRAGALEYSFWFTSNKKNSELYGDQVMEVFLNSRNPIEIDYTNPESYREIVVPADKTRAMSIAEFNEKKGNIKHSQMRQGIELRMSEDKSIDGIIHRNIKDVILSDNFQAFNPNQIKSATENVGTFSAETRNIKFQKANTQQEAIQKAKEKYTLSVEERGNPHKQGVDAALNDLRKSDWYKTADDTQRENAERELKEFFGERLKKAPSVAKILGKPKAKKVIIKDEYKEMIRQIKMEAKAARDVKGDLNIKRRMLSDAISNMVKLGKIKTSQASVLIKRISYLNLNDTVMIERFTNYAQRVFERADYQDRLSKAFEIKNSIRKLLKTDNQAQVAGMAKQFTNIDPSLIDDIDAYIEMADKVKNAVKPSRVKGLDVVMKEAANIAEISEYTNKEIARQEEIQKQELLATYDFLDNEMSLEEMQKVIDALKDPAIQMDTTEKQKYVKNYLNGRFGIMSSILESMFKTGIDPMTGEEITFDEKQKELIKRALNIDLNEMSVREAIKIVESLENFLTNQITSGLEAAVSSYEGAMNDKQLVQKGFKARELKLFASKKVGRVYNEQAFPLALMIERMFQGTTRGTEVMVKWGLTKLINGVNKSIKQLDNSIKEFSKQDFYSSKDFMDAENVYEAGMLAELIRTVNGTPAEMKAEFDKKVNKLKQSINILIKKGNSREKQMGEIYQKVYDKLNVDSMDIDVIKSNASKENLDAVNWWINEWSRHYSDLYDINLAVYNAELSKDLNYTSSTNKKLSSKREVFKADVVERGGSYAMEFTDKNKAGVLIEPTRSANLAENRYINLDFYNNQAKALKAALVDINTASAIRQIDGFMNSEYFDELIPSSEDREIIVRRVNSYIRKAKGKNIVPSDTIQDVDRFLNFVATLGVGKALGGISQSVTQSVPVILNTIRMTGRFDVAGPDFNAWLDKLGTATANRGLESESNIDSIDRKLEAKGKRAQQALKFAEKVSQMYLKLFLSKTDVFVARSSFKSYYLQNLKRRGISIDIDWKTHEPDMEAVEYAEAMVNRQQNVSDPMLAGEFLSSDEPGRKITRKMVFPFTSYILNSKARMYNDLLVISSKTSTNEDVNIAKRSLSALGVELLAFHIAGFAVRTAYEGIASWWYGKDDEDEEKKKLFGIEMTKSQYNATKYPIKSIASDILSPIPGISDNAVTWSLNTALSLYPWMDDKEIKDAVKERNKILELKGEDPMDEKTEAEYIENIKNEATYQVYEDENDRNWGMYGIASDTYKELYDVSKLATTGEFTDEYQGREITKKLLEADRKRVLEAIAPVLFYATGVLPKDVGSVSKKFVNKIKKQAVTEKQYDRYSDVQKDLGRNLKSWEIQLVKDKKESETAISEIEFIERNGGLTERQGREYLKLMKAIGETTVSDIVKIKEGQTADQILK